MSATQQAKRRRRQAAMGFKNMAPMDRPHYKKADKATSQARLERTIERERQRAANKAKKGKKK